MHQFRYKTAMNSAAAVLLTGLIALVPTSQIAVADGRGAEEDGRRKVNFLTGDRFVSLASDGRLKRETQAYVAGLNDGLAAGADYAPQLRWIVRCTAGRTPQDLADTLLTFLRKYPPPPETPASAAYQLALVPAC